jgi:hypothetical protein
MNNYLHAHNVFALLPQTSKHIRGGWSHYADTSEPVVGYGANNVFIVPSADIRTTDLSITSPTRLPTALPGPTSLDAIRKH